MIMLPTMQSWKYGTHLNNVHQAETYFQHDIMGYQKIEIFLEKNCQGDWPSKKKSVGDCVDIYANNCHRGNL